jgi:hypothetical protein
MMVLGPRLGTLAGTLEPMPTCASRAHVATLMEVKYFAWDNAKNAKLRKERGIGFEDIVFHIDCGDLLDIPPDPERTAASASSSSDVRTTCIWCRSSRMSTRSS